MTAPALARGQTGLTEALTFAATWLFYALTAALIAGVITALYLWWKQDR